MKDSRRNNIWLFSMGSFGWVTEESGFCLYTGGNDNLGGGSCAKTWRDRVLGVAVCSSRLCFQG